MEKDSDLCMEILAWSLLKSFTFEQEIKKDYPQVYERYYVDMLYPVKVNLYSCGAILEKIIVDEANEKGSALTPEDLDALAKRYAKRSPKHYGINPETFETENHALYSALKAVLSEKVRLYSAILKYQGETGSIVSALPMVREELDPNYDLLSEDLYFFQPLYDASKKLREEQRKIFPNDHGLYDAIDKIEFDMYRRDVLYIVSVMDFPIFS